LNTVREILVIDDEKVITTCISLISRIEDLKFDQASSVEEGMAQLKRKRYGLVLCDIMMGDRNGFDFLEEMARLPTKVPVIMMSGFSTAENVSRSLSCGAFDFIAKPFTVEEMQAVIHLALRYEQQYVSGSKALSKLPEAVAQLGLLSWCQLEKEGTVRVGASEAFSLSTGDLESITLQDVGSDLVQGGGCASFLSKDGLIHQLISPVSGRVININEQLQPHPDLTAQEPYGVGWLYRVVPSELEYNTKWLAPGGEPLSKTWLSKES